MKSLVLCSIVFYLAVAAIAMAGAGVGSLKPEAGEKNRAPGRAAPKSLNISRVLQSLQLPDAEHIPVRSLNNHPGGEKLLPQKLWLQSPTAKPCGPPSIGNVNIAKESTFVPLY